MLTLEQAATTLGMTPRQLRRRLEATAPVLAPYVGRGDKNRVLLEYGAVRILEDIEQRRANGATLREATEAVAEQLRGNGGGEQGPDQGTNGGDHGGELQALREALRDARAERDYWRQHAERLTAMLEVRALPRPRSWWAWWRA